MDRLLLPFKNQPAENVEDLKKLEEKKVGGIKPPRKKKYKKPKKMRDPDFGNPYKKIKVDKIDKPRNYPEEDEIKIKVPFRMVCTGTTGSGKTSFIRNLVDHISFYTRYVFLIKTTDEPLYKAWIEQLREAEKTLNKHIVDVYDNLDHLSEIKWDKHENNLVIIDDMINSSRANQATVGDLWIKGRKMMVSSIWMTQRFYDTPKQVRENSNLIALKYVPDCDQVKRIMRRAGVASEYDAKQLYSLVKDVVDMKQATLLIDQTPYQEEDYKVRMNLSPINLQTYFRVKDNPETELEEEE